MTHRRILRGLSAVAALAALALPATAAIAEPVDPWAPGRIEVSRSDVNASNEKVMPIFKFHRINSISIAFERVNYKFYYVYY